MQNTVNKKRENFYCMHCGKEQGLHQAKSFHCPAKGRGQFKGFDKMHTFSPDYDSPLPEKLFTI